MSNMVFFHINVIIYGIEIVLKYVNLFPLNTTMEHDTILDSEMLIIILMVHGRHIQGNINFSHFKILNMLKSLYTEAV